MRLESGPARFDQLYYTGFFLLCFGFGLYFFYDWKIGYPDKNAEEARQWLITKMPPANVPDELPEHPTRGDYIAALKANPRTAKDLRDALGEPLITAPGEGGRTWVYFVSKYGRGEVPLRGEQIVTGEVEMWKKWHKTQGEVGQQFWCGLLAILLSLWVLRLAVRAFTLRIVLDDAGLDYGGKRIALDAMTRLADYSPKGLVSLYYKEGAAEKKLRLDNHKIARYEEIVDAIAEAKGFENPRTGTGAADDQPGSEPEENA